MNSRLYYDTRNRVIQLLNEDTKWIQRYKGYAKDIAKNEPMYKAARIKFARLENLSTYLTVSQATKTNVCYDMRYKGQSVAKINVRKRDGSIEISPKTEHNSKYYTDYPPELKAAQKTIPWISKEATCFRKYFKSSPSRKTGRNLEHNFEDQWLKQLASRKSKGKYLINIQPVKLCGEPFQMPTPLKGCEAKGGPTKIEFSGSSGGGIDILARHGKGNPRLAVVELKDEHNKKEPPETAIAQAIAYATFLRTLLRTDNASPADWWKLFGFNRNIPDTLIIKVVIAMPYKTGADTSFAHKQINFEDLKHPKDSLELHFIYFDVDSNNRISGINQTSLA